MLKKMRWQTRGEMRVGQMFERRGITVIYQYSLGPYKLDILLPEININVEVYGPHHLISDRMQSDQRRTEYIASMGYKQYVIAAQETLCTGAIRDLVTQVILENPKLPKCVRLVSVS